MTALANEEPMPCAANIASSNPAIRSDASPTRRAGGGDDDVRPWEGGENASTTTSVDVLPAEMMATMTAEAIPGWSGTVDDRRRRGEGIMQLLLSFLWAKNQKSQVAVEC